MGAGMLISQMNTEQVIHENEDLVYRPSGGEISKMRSDSKFGITFAQKIRGAEYFIILYPRLFPKVRSNTGGFTYDFVEMTAGLSKNMRDYSVFINFMLREVYVYQFNLDLDATTNEFISGDKTYSNYYGLTDLTFGADIKLLKSTPSRSFSLHLKVEAGARLYLRDIKNDNPFKVLNGQGFLTFNPGNYLEGDLFSGIYSTAGLIRIFVLQKFHPSLIIKEGFEVEIAKKPGYRHGLNLFLAVDYRIF